MKKIILAGLISALVGSLSASTLKIGTGGPTGNYFGMTNDVLSPNYCAAVAAEGDQFEVLNSQGSVDNLLGLLNKKYSIGIVQTDVLMSYHKKQPRKVNQKRMKILAGLHIETIHLLVPKNYKPKNINNKSSFFSNVSSMFGSKKDSKPVKMSLNVLKGQDIASWGGSAVSARALSYFFGLNWKVREVPKEQRQNVSTMPILLVGGLPYAPVQEYLNTGNYRLIALDYSEIKEKAPFYLKSTASYNIEGESISVPSIGIQALMIGKAFRKASRNTSMINLSKCINESLGDLADDSDTNPNWESVYELNADGEQIDWDYFKID